MNFESSKSQADTKHEKKHLEASGITGGGGGGGITLTHIEKTFFASRLNITILKVIKLKISSRRDEEEEVKVEEEEEEDTGKWITCST